MPTIEYEEIHTKVEKYLDEHLDFSKQPNGTARDAYIYHLIKLIRSAKHADE
jgi:hypothetical protein